MFCWTIHIDLQENQHNVKYGNAHVDNADNFPLISWKLLPLQRVPVLSPEWINSSDISLTKDLDQFFCFTTLSDYK